MGKMCSDNASWNVLVFFSSLRGKIKSVISECWEFLKVLNKFVVSEVRFCLINDEQCEGTVSVPTYLLFVIDFCP